MVRLLPLIFTALALAAGYGLWVWSDTLVEWADLGDWLPIVRLGTVIVGLSLLELAASILMRFIPTTDQSAQGESP